MKPYNKTLKPLARTLRKTMTDAEKLLWSRLRRKQVRGFQFYRQKPLGRYIVDFYCPAGTLVIEVDGGRHYSDDGKAKDLERDNYLNSIGLNVLRFTNIEVLKNVDGVLQVIDESLGKVESVRKSPLNPPLRKGDFWAAPFGHAT